VVFIGLQVSRCENSIYVPLANLSILPKNLMLVKTVDSLVHPRRGYERFIVKVGIDTCCLFLSSDFVELKFSVSVFGSVE